MVADRRARAAASSSTSSRSSPRCRWRSAPRPPGARAYTATAQPGPALHGRGAVQRLRAGPADRDDGRQPRDRRADQHLERPQRLDVAARLRLDPALRRDQPGGARPAHPGVPARRGAVPAGDGVHGRLHPHARLRARRRADAGAGRRVSAAVRAATDARSRRAGLHRRDGRAGGLHRGALSRARQADARARADPAARRRVPARLRPRRRRPRPHATAPRTPRRSSWRSARCSAPIKDTVDEMRRSGAAHRRGRHRAASGPSRSPRCARRSPARSASSCSRKASPSGIGGIVSTRRAHALLGHPRSASTP